MPKTNDDIWDGFWKDLEALQSSITRSKGVNINSPRLRSCARGSVQTYFRVVRPELRRIHLDVATVDSTMQSLLLLSNGRNRRTSYKSLFRDLRQIRHELEMQREIRYSEILAKQQESTIKLDETEKSIIPTLRRLAPSAANSYLQSIADLSDHRRLSYRGTAAEIRETLRDVLEHLAPDETVMASEDFELEEGQNHPTMRQKVRFIMLSRGKSKTLARVPMDSATIIDESKVSIARSTYNRASFSAHGQMGRDEVQQVKRYLDALLCELLEIRK